MPKPKNHLLRAAVPAVAIIAGLAVAFAVFRNTTNQASKNANQIAAVEQGTTQPPQPHTPPPTTTEHTSPPPAIQDDARKPETQPRPSADTSQSPPDQPATTVPSTPQSPTQPPQPSPRGFRAEVVATDAARAFDPIGALKLSGAGSPLLRIEFSTTGAGVSSIRLADHFQSVEKTEHIEVQSEHVVSLLNGGKSVLVPFAALWIRVNDSNVPLAGSPGAAVWSQESPGAFVAHVLDDSGARALRIERTYSIRPGTHDITLTQRVTNLTSSPLSVAWFQTGPVDLEPDTATYGGDRRRLRFGYLLDAQKDPTRQAVLADAYVISRSDYLGKRDEVRGYLDEHAQWPNKKATENGFTLVWAGLVNRYFGAAVHPLPDAQGRCQPFSQIAGISRIVLDGGPGAEVAGLRLDSQTVNLAAAGAPGQTADFSMGIYAGPLNKKTINADPTTRVMGIAGLVLFNWGGPCGWCVVEWITSPILGLLRWLHTITRDWSLAIVLLVVCIKTILHPVQRFSQVRMNRFGKQMQAMAPKQKALQEKYKGDPKKYQQEVAKLWKEEGVSPAGFLGCLPALLQTPVWMALTTVLFFAVDLRHQGAFYGVFQSIQSQSWPTWQFLADLSEADGLLHANKAFNIWLLSSIIGPVQGLNILPLVLGVVFFIQQKYLTPPSSVSLTPEQEAQQKMMKWMTVVLFPVMMYNAPSGLALYFIVNSTLGIFESRWIRAHMDQLDKKNPPGDRKKKPSESKGFMARVLEAAEARRKTEMEKARAPKGRAK